MSRLVCILERSSLEQVAETAQRMALSLFPKSSGVIRLNNKSFGNAGKTIAICAADIENSEPGARRAPLSYDDNSEGIDVALSGSIYNFKELAKDLNLDPNASAERLLAQGYRKKGIEFFRMLNGEFSFLLFDARENILHVVRDRFGSNLLFCFKDNERFVVASEIKALFKHPAISPKANFTAAHRYLFHHYRYSYGTEDTFFENVKVIPPNSILSITDSKEQTETLWMFDVKENSKISDADAISEFHRLLGKSFERRLSPLRERPAFLLSGGLDSPTIAALAAEKSNSPIKSFSILYGDATPPPGELNYDEREFIKPSVEMHAMDWEAVYPSAEDFPTVFEEMLSRYDEPISSPTWYSHYQLSRKLAESGYTVAFGGDGGDHALAGLYDDIPYFFADLKASGNDELLGKELACWEKLHNHPSFPKNAAVWNHYASTCFDWSQPGQILDYSWDEERMRNRDMYSGLCSQSFMRHAAERPHFPSVSERFLISKLWQDLLFASSPPSTRAEDINFSTFGVSLRSIFLDREFMEFCWSLPGHLMIRNGELKYLIRAAMVNKLPEPVRTRTEHVGLNTPVNLWYRRGLKELIEQTVSTAAARQPEVFNGTALKNVLNEHLSGKADHMMFLWKVFSIEQWFNKWGMS